MEIHCSVLNSAASFEVDISQSNARGWCRLENFQGVQHHASCDVTERFLHAASLFKLLNIYRICKEIHILKKKKQSLSAKEKADEYLRRITVKRESEKHMFWLRKAVISLSFTHGVEHFSAVFEGEFPVWVTFLSGKYLFAGQVTFCLSSLDGDVTCLKCGEVRTCRNERTHEMNDWRIATHFENYLLFPIRCRGRCSPLDLG